MAVLMSGEVGFTLLALLLFAVWVLSVLMDEHGKD